MRSSQDFDGVIDFDRAVADPQQPDVMRAEWQADWLHPNAEGYKAMGKFAAEQLRN